MNFSLCVGHCGDVFCCAASTTDPRVPLWQSLKYLSRLRYRALTDASGAAVPEESVWGVFRRNVETLVLNMPSGKQMVVADVDENAGHFGAAGHSAQTAAQAREYAFLYKALGLRMK